MKPDKQICSLKDKRLLVLLLFGSLILIPRLASSFLPRDRTSLRWQWYEEKENGTLLHRLSAAGEPDARMVTLIGKNHAPWILSEMSARSAFLLGQPFPINRADEAELQMLPGIGPKMAADIVRYRNKHGALTDSNNLTRIHGIGRKTAMRLAPMLDFEDT